MANEQAQQQLPTVRSDKYTRIYANSCGLDINPWDFTFTFGEMKRDAGAVIPKIEEQVAIIMSPQHAKALLGILATNLKEYEKAVGQINLPDTIIPPQTTTSKQ
jgi:hypothetical protein